MSKVHEARREGKGRLTGLVVGVVLLIAGTLFLLDNLDYVDAGPYLAWWPLALVAIGLAEIVQGCFRAGAVWIGAGALILLFNFGVIDVNPFQIFWPTLFTVVGAILVWQALTAPEVRLEAVRQSAFAWMAGNVQKSSAEPVGRVEATAIMGGCEIDLRSAEGMAGGTVVDVFAMWGGIEIRVPEGWRVENRAVPILAGAEVKAGPGADDAPLLILTGTVVMGGVEVRN